MRALQIKRSNPRYGERWIDGFTQSSAGGAIFFHTEKWDSGIIVSESTQKHKNRKKKTSRSMEDNKIRCVAFFSIAESACAKYPVMPVSINFANKNFQIKNACKAYSPENEGYPFCRILRKSLGLRDTERPGVPVHN